ncbi:hypothetical protein [Sporisorium scitamineum]|uniref:Serine aminopeptidase S33 domain-containing protein n=1 Tax=Sporisorium scitamineum TaxID=49012 RepID=A0A0F7RW48_9BASI|nr:hypothetical protein [Sporisorium scitamineum]
MLSKCASLGSTLWEVWGEPLAETLGIHEPSDRSYGRWNVPFSAMEKRLYEKDDVEITFHKAMLENNKDWVWYQVWQDPVAVRDTVTAQAYTQEHSQASVDDTSMPGSDLSFPTYPRTATLSGLHVYQRNMAGFCSGLHAVLHDVARRDQAASLFPNTTPTKLERRQTFMLGLSFGGLVAFSYALQYPASYRYDETDALEIPIDGLIGVGPMVAYNTKFVVVNLFLRFLFMALYYVFQLGRLEVIVPHEKVVDKDPKVYESLIMQDPRSHKGSFRIGHLYCIVHAMQQLRERADEIRHPIYVQMGGEDKARNQHDDLAGRISVIADNVAWMVERSPAVNVGSMARRRQQLRLASYTSDGGSSISRSTSRTSLFDQDDEDDVSVATTVPTTPLLTDSEAFEKRVDGGQGQIHLLPEHLSGWKVDEEGEKRLYRLFWSFREETRPFLYDTNSTASSIAI